MQNFIDHKLSLRASREFRRVIVGRTDYTPMDNGNDIYNAKWRYRKMRYFANFALVTPETQAEITGAVHAAMSMLLLFRFRDPGDFQVEDSPLAVVVGTKTPVQLTKRYYFGSAHGDRLIQAVDHCVMKTDAGVEIPGTLDKPLGLFTPTSNWPAATAKWSGRFCVWVRFASDEFDATMLTLDISTTDVELQEGRAHR
jgi:uncharacterized protein (TIGR02217 family)